MNSLAGRLGLLSDDTKLEGKLTRLCADLASKINVPIGGMIDWRYSEADFTAEQALAADWRKWAPFGPRTVWAKKQGNTWLAAEVRVPA